MVPPQERASLEVIETEFVLEVLVHPLCSPAFLDDPHVLFVAHATRHRREIELDRLVAVERPLDNEPLLLSLIDRGTVLMGRLDATEREASPKCAIGTVSPAQFAAPAMRDGSSQVSYAHRFSESTVCANAPNLRCRVDPHSIIEVMTSYLGTKLTRVPVGAVGKNNLTGDRVVFRTFDHTQRQLNLGLKPHVIRDTGLLSTV